MLGSIHVETPLNCSRTQAVAVLVRFLTIFDETLSYDYVKQSVCKVGSGNRDRRFRPGIEFELCPRSVLNFVPQPKVLQSVRAVEMHYRPAAGAIYRKSKVNAARA